MGPRDTGAAPQKGSQTIDDTAADETRRPLTSSERLPRRQRLTGAEDIRRVLGRGSRHRAANLDIAWLINDAGHPRLGLVIPRFQSSAVARNRLRRRLKEIFRRQGLPRMGAVDIVVRARKEAYRATNPELTAEVIGWLERKGPRS